MEEVHSRVAANFKPGLIRSLLGLSRALISVFVVAQAGLAAVLALGGLPPLEVIIIGVFACLFGSAALIGFNDLMDIEIDRERLQFQKEKESFDMGSLFVHHPVAKGYLSLGAGIAWVAVLSLLSMGLTYMLKPWLTPILLAVAVFVAIYSVLSRKSVIKVFAVAMAVVTGAVAGWLAVAPPNSGIFPLFVLWTFLWEMGGRNIPNDFGDLEEDARIGLKTIPVVYGPKTASVVTFTLILLTIITSGFLGWNATESNTVTLLFVLSGLYFLAVPGYKLLKSPVPKQAVHLFNQACLYPLFILGLLLLNIYLI